MEAGEPLRLEIEAFLEAVRTRDEPVVSGEDGRAGAGAGAGDQRGDRGACEAGGAVVRGGWLVHVLDVHGVGNRELGELIVGHGLIEG